MATTTNTVTADGINATFSVPFPYLDRSHVKVRVNEVLQPASAYEWDTSATIRLLAIPAQGTKVRVSRETPSEPLTEYQRGAILTMLEMSVDSKQALYAVQELKDAQLSGDALISLLEDAGLRGDPGEPGPGVPVGGQPGQIPAKASAANYDLVWIDPPTDTGGASSAAEVALADPLAAYSATNVQDAFGKLASAEGDGSTIIKINRGHTGFLSKSLRKFLEQQPINILDYIPESEHAAIRARTSTFNCTAAFNNAVAAAKAGTNKTIYVPYGRYNINSEIVVDDSNIVIEGDGSGAFSSGTISGRITEIRWTGAGLNHMFTFRSPTGASSQRRQGSCMRHAYVNGNDLANSGIRIQSISVSHFVGVVVGGCIDTQWDIGTVASALADPGDTQDCIFERCGFLAGLTTGTANADGMRLSGTVGNISFNSFLHCSGTHKNGRAIRIINGDNNKFEKLRTFRQSGGTGYSVDIDGNNGGIVNDYNRFLDYQCDAPMRCRGTESGFGAAPMGLFFSPDLSNDSKDPLRAGSVCDASVKVVIERYGTTRIGQFFTPVGIAEDLTQVNAVAPHLTRFRPLGVWASSGGWQVWGSTASAARYAIQPNGSEFRFVRDDSAGNGQYSWDGYLRVDKGVGFWGTTPPSAKPQITGSRGSATASVLQQVVSMLASYGICTDSTTA